MVMEGELKKEKEEDGERQSDRQRKTEYIKTSDFLQCFFNMLNCGSWLPGRCCLGPTDPRRALWEQHWAAGDWGKNPWSHLKGSANESKYGTELYHQNHHTYQPLFLVRKNILTQSFNFF